MSAKKEGQKEVKQKGIADGVPVYCAHDKIIQTVQLIPNPANPNKHPDDQIKMLAKIIKASGWRQPITVSNRSGYIVKGHGRLMAAQLAGLDEVPVDFQDYATEAEEYADLIADNRIAELSEIDNKLLADVFAEIDTGEIDLDQTGYTETEIEQIVTHLAESIHDELEDGKGDDFDATPAAKPVTQYGDLWIIGKHRVMCGDCTNKADRALLLDGAEPQILLTDPPYCSGGQQESKKSTGSIGTAQKGKPQPKIANDILSTRGYQNLIAKALTDIPCVFAYVFTDWRMWIYLFDLIEAAGFGCKSMIVWDKVSPGMGMGWRSQHELCMFGARASCNFDGHKGYGNVIRCQRSGNELHPTQKPLELFEALLDNTDFAAGVYDPFGGSGTTMAAAEKQGQQSYIMELTPAFTDTIVRRYIQLTGDTNISCIRNGKELPRKEWESLLAAGAGEV
ncbi:MAG: site-specific DNA-methyltransferase [Lachnospiraceae bacterium]|nr:site-specific DNA-methyltransferase [Lachnospiraceae bacterium]